MKDAIRFKKEVPSKLFCKKCNSDVPVFLSEDTHHLHGHKRLCVVCESFLGWNGRDKELKDERGLRIKSSNWTPQGLGVNKCQMCLRPKKFLGEGETLEVHHMVSVRDGGLDDPNNIWVLCTSCHKIVHHRRTYIYEHMKPFFKAYEAWERNKNNQPYL